MNNLNNTMQDQPLMPMLYIENVPEKHRENICRQFSLKSEKYLTGYLLQSSTIHPNFKMSFLDLFFGALCCFSHHSEMSFLLFEKNHLREELEQSILGAVNPETSMEAKINEWKKKHFSHSLSGFAQATLYQAGLIDGIEIRDIDLSIEQLNKILEVHFKRKTGTTKVA